MKLHLPVLGALSFSLLFPAARTAMANADEERSDEMATEILVDLKDNATDADEKEVESRLGGLHLHANSAYAAAHDKIFIAEVDPTILSELIDKIKDDPNVENVEPNFVYKTSMIPNDPMFDKQWSFRMIDAPTAWDSADGKGVIVAVIDTGVAYENYDKFKQVEDLSGTEFVQGYDFVSDDDHANDDHGHGTHVAGTIAQATNNGVGVAGLAFRAKIMPLKVLNKNGMGTAADIADAIRFAADEGANVINMSLGGGGRSMAMESAVAYARKKGVVVVCAAGNGSQGRVEFPAAYKGSFAVSAVGPDKELAFYSSWGKELAISAPGGDSEKGGDAAKILQNTITPQSVGVPNQYLAFQGTSMATPHVAGAAALVMSAGVTDADKVEQILRESAEPKAPADKYGAGILNVGRAVEAAHEMAGGKWHLAAGLGAFFLFLIRFGRRLAGAKIGLGALLGTVIGASGLWFLKYIGFHFESVPSISFLATPMPDWDEAAVGATWHFTALWASALPLVLTTVLLVGIKRLRGLLLGLALGWATYFVVSAVLMPADVQFIPGAAGVLDRVWLVVNAGVLLVLARLIAGIKPRTA
jgi:serine protease